MISTIEVWAIILPSLNLLILAMVIYNNKIKNKLLSNSEVIVDGYREVVMALDKKVLWLVSDITAMESRVKELERHAPPVIHARLLSE